MMPTESTETQTVPKMIKAVLFDLDGTLTDSRAFLIESTFQTLEHFFPGQVEMTQLNEQFGIGFKSILEGLPFTVGDEVYNTFAETKKREYVQRVLWFPGVESGLHHLRSCGYKLGIVTNQMREITIAMLRSKGLDELFDTIVALEDVTEAKPSAEPVCKALEMLGVDAAEACLVGDSIYDLQAANEAGTHTILMNWNRLGWNRLTLNKWEANERSSKVCHDFEEFLQWLETNNQMGMER